MHLLRTSRFYLWTLAGVLVGNSNGDTPVPSTTDEAPRFELRAGEKFFRVNHEPMFVLGRNPAAMNPKAYEEHFRNAAAAGERFVRIHFTFIPPSEKPGEIDAAMLKTWDEVLDAAENNGLAVLPVLGVWADWNDGSNKETWHRWDQNPFNVERGGPAKLPNELFDDTPCRKLWLKRVETFVKHWSHRRAIVGWEIFSELDLVTGATEQRAVQFAERAAAVIRETDPWKRPVTASQSGIGEWPELVKSSALDFSEIHPYTDGAFGGRLDDLIISTVRERLKKYGKPVLIGESGLNSGPPRGTLEVADRAEIGIRNAIWASVVSGAMNGRMLWWEDGYDQLEKADLCRHYERAAAPAAEFVRDVNYAGFVPISCDLPVELKGAMIGNDRLLVGWFRDARCIPPEWPMERVSSQDVTVKGLEKSWQVEFFDTITGKGIGTTKADSRNQILRVVLPPFEGSVAVKLKQLNP